MLIKLAILVLLPQSGETISGESTQKLYIPLQFWFCRNIGSSLPLISLPHQDVKINIEFRNLNELVKSFSISYYN